MCKQDLKPDHILDIMETIAHRLQYLQQRAASQPSYPTQRTIISSLFTHGGSYDEITIQKRLVVIDSLYSTNARYSYFSFDEMAKRIYDLGTEESYAQEYFYRIAKGGLDDYAKDKNEKGLFGRSYGIKKNLKSGAHQTSLLSKYAYYALMSNKKKYPLGFPIYDSLAKAMYTRVMCKLYTQQTFNPLPEVINIEKYVKEINKLRELLFGKDNIELYINEMQQFDILDAYLWRMGKIDNGNLSLLLSRTDYEKFIKNIKLDWDITYDKKNKDYKERMMRKYGDDFDFDKIIKDKLASPSSQPFNGCTSEIYMNKLYLHWKEYIMQDKNKPGL